MRMRSRKRSGSIVRKQTINLSRAPKKAGSGRANQCAFGIGAEHRIHDSGAIIEITELDSEVNKLLALLEGCKHSLEISVPVEEVETETGKVVSTFQAK